MLRVRLLVLCFLLLAPFAFAQREFGSIQGTVTESDAAAIPGAMVTVSGPSLIGGSATQISDQDGSYRFPMLAPGLYEVKAELQGFQSIIRKDIRVFVGSTVTVDFTLQMQTLSETVTVSGASPLIDSTTTSVSQTVPLETITTIPKPPSILDILTLTPGVNSSPCSSNCGNALFNPDIVAYGAAGTSANRYWFDGVDISSPRSGGLLFDINYNFISEVQVTGIGAPAEYGNFTGVVGNFVTRSGSNQFHGLFETFFQNQALVSTNAPDPGPESPFTNWQSTVQMGGPLILDRFWFFAGGAYNSHSVQPFGYDGTSTEKQGEWIGKLSYKANQNNKLQGFVYWNHGTQDADGAAANIPPEATLNGSDYASGWNATWVSLLGKTNVLEVRFGGIWASYINVPKNGDIPGHLDARTGVISVNALGNSSGKRFRPQLNAAFSHHAENFIKGNHDFKFGFEFERSRVDAHYHFNGGLYYYDYFGSPYYRFLWEGYDEHDSTHRLSSYAQDDWSATKELTLSFGVRWDNNRGLIGDQTVFKTDPVSPRIGFVYDVRANGKTVLKAHYGRYAEGMFDAFYHLLYPRAPFITEIWNAETEEWDVFPIVRLLTQIDPGLKHPYVDQFTIGIDQELPGGIALGAHYIGRKWKNLIEDIDPSTRYEPITVINPITQEPITVYNRLDFGDINTLLTNPPGLFRRYDGLEIFLNRHFSNKLNLSGSIVVSKVKGNIPNTSITIFPFSPLLNDPNTTVNFEGRLVNDPTLAWKVVGSYNFPWGINTGFFFRHESGDTWAPTISIRGLDQGPVRVFGLPRGINRLPSRNILDLRMEKEFGLFNGQLRFTADIFNLLNAATVTSVQERFEAPDFGQPIGFTDPRAIRLGLRYTF